MSDFTARIAHCLRGVEHFSTGAMGGCEECGLGDNEEPTEHERAIAEEGGFSNQPCESCESPLAGNRYPAHGITFHNGRTYTHHFSICTDCLQYHANGDEPEPETR